MEQKSKINESRAAVSLFGIGSATSLGNTSISFPLWNFRLSSNVYVVDANAPILLSVDDMERLGFYCNNLEFAVVHALSGLKFPITRICWHFFIHRNPLILCFLATVEVPTLYRRFRHPSTDRLMKVLKKSGLADIVIDIRRVLLSFERCCDPYHIYAQKPRRFKFTLRDGKEFNHVVYADTFSIEGKPVFHVVDESTNLHSAKRSNDMFSETLWRASRMC